jgi:hypothetical protein
VTLDHLLLWLSAKGAGSWPQFRAAVEELHIEQERIEPMIPMPAIVLFQTFPCTMRRASPCNALGTWSSAPGTQDTRGVSSRPRWPFFRTEAVARFCAGRGLTPSLNGSMRLVT